VICQLLTATLVSPRREGLEDGRAPHSQASRRPQGAGHGQTEGRYPGHRARYPEHRGQVQEIPTSLAPKGSESGSGCF
jgi:hypothetical protein